MTFSVDALQLSVEQVSAITTATVDVTMPANTPAKYPFVLVQASAATPVINGRPELAAEWTLTAACMDVKRADSRELADQVLAGLMASWRQGRRTGSGWISRISVAAFPTLVEGGAVGDNTWRTDIVLDVVGRH